MSVRLLRNNGACSTSVDLPTEVRGSEARPGILWLLKVQLKRRFTVFLVAWVGQIWREKDSFGCHYPHSFTCDSPPRRRCFHNLFGACSVIWIGLSYGICQLEYGACSIFICKRQSLFWETDIGVLRCYDGILCFKYSILWVVGRGGEPAHGTACEA